MQSEVCIPFEQNKTGISNIRCNAGYLAARIKGGWERTRACSWRSLYVTRYRQRKTPGRRS